VVRKIEKARVNNSCNWRAQLPFILKTIAGSREKWMRVGSIGVDFVATSSDFRLQIDFESRLPLFKKMMEWNQLEISRGETGELLAQYPVLTR
jgi:hypothetical protein